MTRRGGGEGTISKRKSDGRWEGKLSAGWGDNGRRRRVIVYGATRAEVAVKLREAQARLASGQPLADGRLTVASYLTGWVETLSLRVRPSTEERYRELVRRHIIATIGHVRLAKLTPQQVEKMLADRSATGLAPRTVLHIRGVLRAAIHDAQRQGLVSANSASLARPPRVEAFHVTPMTSAAAAAILDAVAGTEIEAPVNVALYTGLRQGEILALRWGDVDLTTRRLAVRGTLQRRQSAWFIERPKTERSTRVVTVPDALVDVLNAHRQRQRERRLAAGPAWSTAWPELIFTDAKGLPIVGSTLTHTFRLTLERAGLKSCRFHDLRHGAATLMLASGVDITTISAILGHSTLAVTSDFYAHVLDEVKANAADKLATFIRRSG